MRERHGAAECIKCVVAGPHVEGAVRPKRRRRIDKIARGPYEVRCSVRVEGIKPAVPGTDENRAVGAKGRRTAYVAPCLPHAGRGAVRVQRVKAVSRPHIYPAVSADGGGAQQGIPEIPDPVRNPVGTQGIQTAVIGSDVEGSIRPDSRAAFHDVAGCPDAVRGSIRIELIEILVPGSDENGAVPPDDRRGVDSIADGPEMIRGPVRVEGVQAPVIGPDVQGSIEADCRGGVDFVPRLPDHPRISVREKLVKLAVQRADENAAVGVYCRRGNHGPARMPNPVRGPIRTELVDVPVPGADNQRAVRGDRRRGYHVAAGLPDMVGGAPGPGFYGNGKAGQRSKQDQSPEKPRRLIHKMCFLERTGCRG